MAKNKTAHTKKSDLSANQKVSIGVGLTAAAVAAAGAYFLYGSPNAGKNRKQVKSWAFKAKGEVLEALEKAEKMTAEEYQSLVEAIAGTYAVVQGVTKGEIADFKKEMQDNWSKIEKSAIAKKAKKVASKTVKTVAVKMGQEAVSKVAPKKAAKKAPKKAAKK